ncbi:efflux RND transporter permease subunit [Roseibacillus ishigakijimensis]|uniref:Efflux RND transporter permease subunit n=1 Tax=Roseibacillus ishigakijimensis TaxID=454146 RepID=A0A934VM57_9BACT|nr:efflux RND transporter permease subunit [Roseibacillus ishigakijimensis]MBK1833927.1 efflux RND transporter permease subunit [Roseibacillus ishigakijimensis]
MEGAVRWFTRNHVAGNFLMLAVLLAGVTTWFKVRKEIFPDTAFDALTVSIPYPNATPEEVERGVVVPVEEAIADVLGIKKMTSTSAQNTGAVTIEVETGYEVRNVMDDVKTRVDAIDNFPEEAEKPILEEVVITSPVMAITLVADGADEATLNRLAEEMKDELLAFESRQAPGFLDFVGNALAGKPRITKVSIAGTRPYEISLEVSEERLQELGLTLGQVAEAVRRYSVDLPAGSIRTQGGELIVRTVGKKFRAVDFARVPVKTLADGSVVRLEQVADLIDGFEDVDLSVDYDQREAVVVNVYRVGEQDTTRLAKLVEEYVAWKNEQALDGVQLGIWNDQSEILKGRIDLLARNAVTGLLLVLVVLALFLRPSLALLVALGIPVSFAGGMWLMPMMGISINMISLFAFILVLGIVVDDAIVTGENVYSRIQGGEHPSLAAWKGTHEVGTVVIFGVLTTVVAFTPMLGLSGVSGKIWPNIPLVVIPTLLFSLVQSKFVLPSHLALLGPTKSEEERQREPRWKKMAAWNPLKWILALSTFLFWLQHLISEGLLRFIRKVYQPALNFGLRWRYPMIALFFAVFVVSLAVVGTGRIKAEFFPVVEGDVLSAKLELAQGVPFSETQRIVEEIESAAVELGERYRAENGEPVVKHILASSGTQPFLTGFTPGGPPKASHLGEVTIELVPSAQRRAGSDELVEAWRELVGAIPGVVELSFKAETAAGGNAIDLKLTGTNLEELEAATAFAKERLNDYQGVIDIADSSRAGKDEIQIVSLTRAGETLGFTLGEVGAQVRDAFYGNEVQRLQRGRDEVKVMVRLPEDDRRTVETIEKLELVSPAGERVALSEIAVLEFGSGPAVINRTDRKRSIKITADVDGETNANEVVARYTEEVLNQLNARFPSVTWGFEGEQEDQANSVREIGMGFLAALVVMYVLIAIPLKSYFQPLIILSVIPFGLIGGIWGHGLLGMNLSIMSMVGFVALAGVVVNDSLVLVEFVNRHRAELGSAREAALQAGGRRFRAILLTSLTTFAGLLPMLAEQDMQAKFLVPMAVSLGFGIIFATLITLFLVPAVYVVLDDIERLLKWAGRRVKVS